MAPRHRSYPGLTATEQLKPSPPVGWRNAMSPRSNVSLVPFSERDFATYIEARIEPYAQERARNTRLPLPDEREVARQQLEVIAGEHKAGKVHGFKIVAGEDGVVGLTLLRYDRERKFAFVLDIEVHDQFRKRGIGTEALRLLEEEAKGLGALKLGLNVFDDNEGARRLYIRQGYYDVAHLMQRDLS